MIRTTRVSIAPAALAIALVAAACGGHGGPPAEGPAPDGLPNQLVAQGIRPPDPPNSLEATLGRAGS
ncbi:hypothetical protein ACWGI9_29880 [Streptomyces sp. NPDC054833]